MLTQFEKEKEKASAESGASSSSSSVIAKPKDSFLYDNLVELLAERKALREELNKIFNAPGAKYNKSEHVHPYQHIQTVLALVQEDIGSVIAAAQTDIDQRAVNTNSNNNSNDNQEIKKFSDLKL